jgi:hypothetical protein
MKQKESVESILHTLTSLVCLLYRTHPKYADFAAGRDPVLNGIRCSAPPQDKNESLVQCKKMLDEVIG